MPDTRSLIENLKQQRDELKLKMHLAQKDAQTEWESLEKKWESIQDKIDALQKEAVGSSRNVGSAVGLVAEEIKKGYDRLRKLM